MKTFAFGEVVRKCPVIVPVFEITKVPDWAANHGIKKGDTVFWNNGYDSIITEDGIPFNLGPSSLKFIGYKDRTEVFA